MRLRIYQVTLALIALLLFAGTSWFTVNTWERRLEIFIFALVLLSFILPAYRSQARMRISTKWLGMMVGLIVVSAITKHYFFPCLAELYVVVEFSWLFHAGQAVLIMAVLCLWRQTSSYTFFYFCTLVAVIAASYSRVTELFLVGVVIYAIVFVLCSYHQTKIVSHTFFLPRFQAGIIALTFIFAFGVILVLALYRDELGSWQPFEDQRDTTRQIGFSPYSNLQSVTLAVSTRPVMRYYAPPGCYYLRGKIFDFYSQGRWKLADEKMTTIAAIPFGIAQYHFPLIRSATIQQTNQLVMLDNHFNIVFLPLDAVQITTSHKYNLYSNQEKAIWGPPGLPNKLIISTDNTWQRDNMLSTLDEQRYCSVPEPIKPYFLQISQEITSQATTPQAKVQAILQYLAQHYRYQTTVTLAPEIDPIESFLKQQQGGHCELFASALVMLARSQGIPARYVTGYYVYEWNQWGHFFTIRDCDAHAWAEVFYPGMGWQTIEATPGGAVEETLQDFRVLGSTFWETICEIASHYEEQFSQFWASYGRALIVMMCLMLILFLFRKKWSKKTLFNLKNKTVPVQFRRCHPQLQKLWLELVYVAPSLSPRLPQQTLHEWLLTQQKYLTYDQMMYARELLQTLETDLYSKTRPSADVIAHLILHWENIKKA